MEVVVQTPVLGHSAINETAVSLAAVTSAGLYRFKANRMVSDLVPRHPRRVLKRYRDASTVILAQNIPCR